MQIKVKGLGLTTFGELWDKSFEDLFKASIDQALEDSKLKIEDIDQVVIGSMLSGEVAGQSHVGSLISSLYGVNIPCLRVEGACASGGLAVYQAIQALESGVAKNILVVGVEKMTDFPANEIADFLMQAASVEERESGATFPSLYGMMAQAHMSEFGTKREQLAAASVLTHKNALQNELAQFKKHITVEDVLKSSSVAEPLNLLDCSPVTDGAAALILSKEEAKEGIQEAFILASTSATDTLSLTERESITGLKSTQIASKQAFDQLGLSPADIDIIEVHDCFSIAALMALEDIGFVKKGKGGEALERILNGDKSLPALNVSGGLKACGHPVGATGVKQIAEIVLQLRQEAGDRQIENSRYGLAQNVGGTGGTCVIHILGNSEVIKK